MSDVADVAIIGGGPVGAALATALCGSGLDVRLLEARRAGHAVSDPRPLAISYGSRLILERLGAWEGLQPATAIERIHVSQRGGFGRVMLSAQEADLPALGYVVDYTQLHRVLESMLPHVVPHYLAGARMLAVKQAGDAAIVDFEAGGAGKSLQARLVVIADGSAAGREGVKTVEYHQSAITARVRSERSHDNVAFERFTSDGPLALLPAGGEFALVWTTGNERAQELCRMPSEAFLQELQGCFGDRRGRFTHAGPRTMFPLSLRQAAGVTWPRTLLIGNAAQTLHPVAGQGFNLGLRDAWELAQELVHCDRGLVGDARMIAAYHARRRFDRGAGAWFTDSLVKLFSNDLPPLRVARGAGLALLACAPPLRDFVARRMIFGARG